MHDRKVESGVLFLSSCIPYLIFEFFHEEGWNAGRIESGCRFIFDIAYNVETPQFQVRDLGKPFL